MCHYYSHLLWVSMCGSQWCVECLAVNVEVTGDIQEVPAGPVMCVAAELGDSLVVNTTLSLSLVY